MVIFERYLDTTLSIEVDGLLPERLQGLSESEISAIPLWIGRQQVELADVFRVQVRPEQAWSVRFSGLLKNVHRIGFGMKSGLIELETESGRHVGAQMEGGEIIAQATVGDFAGAEMRGGLLRICGNAGSHLGGCYPGSKWGINRGEILVAGNAGQGVGERMRRGLIAVEGNVGRLCGWNLWAGSIIVGGKCEAECGLEMIRGSIIQLGKDHAPLMPTFIQGSVYSQAVLNLLAARLKELKFARFADLLNRNFVTYHGDQLTGGRGEVMVAI